MKKNPSKDQAAPVVVKKLRRAFYSLGNGSNFAKRMLISGTVLAVPAYGIATFVTNGPPSAVSNAHGAEMLAQYSREINALAAGNLREDFTSAQARKNLHDKSLDLAARITLDRQISEADTRELAQKFLSSAKGTLARESGSDVRTAFSRLQRFAGALDETRETPDYLAMPPAQRAQAVQAAAKDNYTDTTLLLTGIGDLIFMTLTAGAFRGVYQLNRRRLSAAAQEDLNDTFAKRKRELEGLLKPTSPPRRKM